MAMPTLEDILRDRITELEEVLSISRAEVQGLSKKLVEAKKKADYWECEAKKWCNELGEMKIAEEQGLLLRLPCKVGNMLYESISDNHIHHLKVIGYRTIDGDWAVETNVGPVPFRCIGKTVFLAREAAEEALKGGDGE